MDAAAAREVLATLQFTRAVTGLLVAAPAEVVGFAISGCGCLPNIDDLTVSELDQGVVRVFAKRGEELLELRRRLDSFGAASALEWGPTGDTMPSAPAAAEGGASLAPTLEATPPPASPAETTIAATPTGTQPATPPMEPLAAQLVQQLGEAEAFLAERWDSHRMIKKGQVGLWRKPVDGFDIAAVKVRGVVPGLDCEELLMLMRNAEVKIEMAKSMPTPIKKFVLCRDLDAWVGGGKVDAQLLYQANKFPMPLNNRHACYIAASCVSPGVDENGLAVKRWLYVEQSVQHEALAEHDESSWSSSLTEWKFMNMMMLEQSGPDVIMTVGSQFDIGGFMPAAAMDLLIDDFGDMFSNWQKVIDGHPKMIGPVLAAPRAAVPELRAPAPAPAVAAAAATAPAPSVAAAVTEITAEVDGAQNVAPVGPPGYDGEALWSAVSAGLEHSVTQLGSSTPAAAVLVVSSYRGGINTLARRRVSGYYASGRNSSAVLPLSEAMPAGVSVEQQLLPGGAGLLVWQCAGDGCGLPFGSELPDSLRHLLVRPEMVAALAVDSSGVAGHVVATGSPDRAEQLLASCGRDPVVVVLVVGRWLGPPLGRGPAAAALDMLRATMAAQLLAAGLGLHVELQNQGPGRVHVQVDGSRAVW